MDEGNFLEPDDPDPEEPTMEDARVDEESLNDPSIVVPRRKRSQSRLTMKQSK